MIDAVAAFFAAVLSGMGVGGGGLLLIWLTLVSETPQHTAQFMNLCFFIAASASSMTVHVTKRRIPVLLVLLLASGGAVGSFFGVLTASLTDPDALRIVLGVFLALSGAVSFLRGLGRRKNVRTKDKM